ncbi:MAG: hypothetical protein JW913_20340 [Chitinispirillaceae bacterium]|nr:hypothetical protein [Chitinispirillaceae bacterium]
MSIHFVRIGFVTSVFLVTMVYSGFSENRKDIDATSEIFLFVKNNESSMLNKPNNLSFTTYYDMPRTIAHLTWDPPLPGDNHLLGYICYFSKLSADIDTSKPIDPSQWDSVAFTSETELTIEARGGYLNLVALYNEGKSDFLEEWIHVYLAIGVSTSMSFKATITSDITRIRKTPAGYLLDFQSFSTNGVPQSAVILSSSGRRVAELTDTRGDQQIFNISNPEYSPGLYIVKVLFSDKSTMAKQFNLIQ